MVVQKWVKYFVVDHRTVLDLRSFNICLRFWQELLEFANQTGNEICLQIILPQSFKCALF